MASIKFYPEDILVQKYLDGEFDMLDVVNHHSTEWQDEYIDYCTGNHLDISPDSAERFVDFKGEEFAAALERGDV